MKVFISQKMRDLTEKEIVFRRNLLIDLIKKEYEDEKVEIIESWHPDFDKNSVAQLGQSIIEMSDAQLILISEKSVDNIVHFIDTSEVENIKGSEIEVLICLSYKIPYKIYTFDFDETGGATSAKWI